MQIQGFTLNFPAPIPPRRWSGHGTFNIFKALHTSSFVRQLKAERSRAMQRSFFYPEIMEASPAYPTHLPVC